MVAVSARRPPRRIVATGNGQTSSRASQGTAAGSKHRVQPTRVLQTNALEAEDNMSAERSSRPKRVKAATDYTQFFNNEADGEYERPARLTRTATLNKAQLAAYQNNINSSRLLRLPPELRERIWKLVLGGRTFHIWEDPARNGRLSRSICNRRDRDNLEVEIIKNGPNTTDRDYISRHLGCNIPQSTVKTKVRGMGLEALLICRQVHREAALLPMQENTFQLRSVDALKVFMDHLMPAQSRAIQRLNIVFTETHEFWNDLGLKAQLKKDLVSLKSFELFVEFEPGFDFEIASNLIPTALRTYDKVKMDQVSVAAYYVPDYYDEYDELPTRAKMNEWGAAMEKMLREGKQEGRLVTEEDEEEDEESSDQEAEV